jgi:hypothetical protein
MHGPPVAEETHQLEALTLAVEELRRRVAALEEWSSGVTVGAAPSMQTAPAAFESSELPDVSSGLLAALGRLLLGIAGAYLLRAIAEAGILPPLAGTLVGLAYAAAWLVSSVRIQVSNRLSVAMHGITAACIVAPLLWEATVRFHTFAPTGAAAALAVFVVLGQAFAWYHDHSALAGVTAFAGSATAIALIIATLDPVPFATALAVGAAVVEFGAGRNRALGWRWIIALTVDFCACLLVYLVTRPQGLPEGYASVPIAAVGALLIALVAIYVATTATRTLLHGNTFAWFELLQVATIVIIALVGGLRISHGAAATLVSIGVACLSLGAGCYAVAFTDLASKPARNFHTYATFALLLVLTGSVLIFPGLAAMVWSALAVAATWFGSRRRGITLQMHGGVYLFAAAAQSGLLSYSAGAIIGGTDVHALRLTAGAAFCAFGAVVAYVVTLLARKHGELEWTDRVPASLVAALLCWSFAGLAAGGLLRASFEASLASTFRTILVALVAVTLAWFGRDRNLRELIWILFPWMVFGAAKLVSDDFRQGQSATLFLSLLVYGATLIALPRLLRRNQRS